MDDNWFGENLFPMFGNMWNVNGKYNDPKVKRAYKDASRVDIDEQLRKCDERAKGYWGEFKVFTILYKELDFPNKMLVNLQIPSDNGKNDGD